MGKLSTTSLNKYNRSFENHIEAFICTVQFKYFVSGNCEQRAIDSCNRESLHLFPFIVTQTFNGRTVVMGKVH